MPVRGDFAALHRLREAFESLGDAQPDRASAAAEAVERELAASFATRTSPEGRSWAPTAEGEPALDETGALASSFSVSATEEGVEVTSSAPYAAAHQAGFTHARSASRKRIAARPFLPARDGSRWSSAIEQEVAGSMRRHLGGRE